MTTETYLRLKKEVEQAQREAERARGALEQLIVQLKKEFGCGSVKEAKTALQALCEEREMALNKLKRALKEYEEKWKNSH